MGVSLLPAHAVQTERQLAATGMDDVEALSRLTVLLGQQVCADCLQRSFSGSPPA
jgi:hypothetical protein